MANKSRKARDFAAKVTIGLLKVLSWLPLSVSQFFGKLTGRLMSMTNNKQRFIASANISAAYPKLNENQRKSMVNKVLKHNAQSIFELGAMWFWPEKKINSIIRHVHGKEYLQAAFDQGQGVIVLAPHIGNWELMGCYLSMHYPSTFMYQPPKLAPIEQPMRQSRMRFGAALAPTDLCGVKQVMKALKSNQLTAILPDQDAGENGVHAPFMGHPVRTMTLISRLLQKTKAACVLAVALRDSKGSFELHFMPADREGLENVDQLQAALSLNQAVEQCVALAPEQYLWTYKRFKGQPEGAPDIYR